VYDGLITYVSSTHIWHMLTRDHTVLRHTHTLIHAWNELYLPLSPSCRPSLPFGW